MAPVTDGPKKRKPPTFRHLPIDRAKKLKRSWVEVQKIKSQWKAQKRKEGLVTKERQLDQLLAEADEEKKSQGDQESDADILEEKDHTSDSEREGEFSEAEDGSEGAGSSSPRTTFPPAQRKGETHGKESLEGKPTLRELQRQAYSRTSLHTHKADPLHHRHDSAPKRGNATNGHGRGQSRGRGQERGRGRGAGVSQRGQGRGQPDMRLRMNAMLEKIKRDLA